MEVGKKRRLIYVTTAIAAAVVLILAVILLQQPIQPSTTPPPTKVAPSVSTVDATGVDQTVATLNGNLGKLGSASHSFVGFLYSTDSSFAGATNTTVANASAVTTFHRALSGLSSGTAYYFKAWALGDGFSLGFALTFTTLTPSVPPQHHAPTVATDDTSAITATDATLNGNLADLGTASSVTIGFRYATTVSLTSATNLTLGAKSATGAFEDGITDLKPNTTYYAQAWGLGDGYSFGAVVMFTTKATPSGNGHHVPPGWAHAACPEQAKGNGVRARCDLGETYGQMKKEQKATLGESALRTPPPFSHAAALRMSDPGNSGAHRSDSARIW